MKSLRNLFNKININTYIRYGEPLSKHSSFRIGGEADVYAEPENTEELENLVSAARRASVPFMMLGAGANILFSDDGFRGVVISTSRLNTFHINENRIVCGAGADFSSMAEASCSASLEGLECFYGMPGSAGGSIYMNARCYGKSVSDILYSVKYLDNNGNIVKYISDPGDFSYKISPFQSNRGIITEAEFVLAPGEKGELTEKMRAYKKEREEKGHYTYPCAGSFFKNNRDFGEPSGKIIDRLGLKGFSVGGAMVSPLHANIIVNAGNALSADVKELASLIQGKVYDEFGFTLEREVIYIDRE